MSLAIFLISSLLENKLEEIVTQNIKYHKEKYSSNLSYKEAVYVSLIGLREFLRINPLLFLCNSRTAYNIYYNDPQLSAFARNYIYVDDENYPQKFISQKAKKLYRITAIKSNNSFSVLGVTSFFTSTAHAKSTIKCTKEYINTITFFIYFLYSYILKKLYHTVPL